LHSDCDRPTIIFYTTYINLQLLMFHGTLTPTRALNISFALKYSYLTLVKDAKQSR
jgi:hypothetical protein